MKILKLIFIFISLTSLLISQENKVSKDSTKKCIEFTRNIFTDTTTCIYRYDKNDSIQSCPYCNCKRKPVVKVWMYHGESKRWQISCYDCGAIKTTIGRDSIAVAIHYKFLVKYHNLKLKNKLPEIKNEK